MQCKEVGEGDGGGGGEVEWFAYFPLLHDVYGPMETEDEARDEAGPFGMVLGPCKKRDKRGVGMMAQRTTEKTAEIIGYMLKELEMPAKKLTKWELGFVESVAEQFGARGSLSDRQFEVLERIYEKTRF